MNNILLSCFMEKAVPLRSCLWLIPLFAVHAQNQNVVFHLQNFPPSFFYLNKKLIAKIVIFGTKNSYSLPNICSAADITC
jgi:hypothetical protein